MGPDKKLKLILVYTMTTGRNFDEVLRVNESGKLTEKKKEACIGEQICREAKQGAPQTGCWVFFC
jgi:alkyl hydroperoxide reductase subunit AhpC